LTSSVIVQPPLGGAVDVTDILVRDVMFAWKCIPTWYEFFDETQFRLWSRILETYLRGGHLWCNTTKLITFIYDHISQHLSTVSWPRQTKSSVSGRPLRHLGQCNINIRLSWLRM